MTDTPTTDPHDLCMTDPDKGLCAVAIPLVEAAWCAVVEAGAAGEVDREETMPVLIAALGGVQHHLGHRLGEDVVVTVTFRSEDIHQSITDMINRIIRDPNGRAAEANPDGAKAKCSMAECPNPQAAWGVCGEHMLDIGRDICAEENPAQPGEICWKPSSHGAVEGTPCRYAPAAELERADPFEHPTGAPCTDPWCDDKTGHETHADDRASQTAPAENRCAHCGDVIHLIDGTDVWKHQRGPKDHAAEPANLTAPTGHGAA